MIILPGKVKEFSARHAHALAVAACVALVYGSFHLFMLQEATRLGGKYRPAIVEGNFDEGYYALRAAEAFRGDFPVGDTNLYEFRNSPAFLPILNPLVIALLGWISGSLENAFMLSDFLFPPIIFMFVYLIARELISRRDASIAFGALFMIAPKFALLPSSAALPFFSSLRSLYFSRFEYPNVTFVFFAAALYFILRTLKRPDQNSMIAAGVSTGLLFYTYFYDWTYILCGLLLLVLFLVFAKEYDRAKRIGGVIALALLVSVFYWVNFLKLIALPAFADLAERIGLEHGRMFRLEIVWTSYVRGLLLVFILWSAGEIRRHKETLLFFAAFLLPIIVLLNVQVVTGFVPHPDHWHRTQFLILALSLFVIFFALLKSYEHAFSKLPESVCRMCAVVVIVGSLWYGINVNHSLSAQDGALFIKDQSHAYAYEWLRNNTRAGSVVGTLSSRTNDEIILYTDNYIFTPNGLQTVASTEEIWRRAMFMGKIFNLTRDEFEAMVKAQTLYFFVDQYRNASFNSYMKRMVREVPDSILKEKLNDYDSLPDFSAADVPYTLDYVVVDARSQLLGADNSYLSRYGQMVYRNAGIDVYRIIERR